MHRAMALLPPMPAMLSALAVLLAVGAVAPSHAAYCVDQPSGSLICNALGQAGLCSDANAMAVTRELCPLTCSTCIDEKAPDEVWFCAFPPKDNPTLACRDFRNETCQKIPLRTCTLLHLEGGVGNNFVIIAPKAADVNVFQWSVHLDPECKGTGVLRGTKRPEGATMVGECFPLLLDVIGHFVDIAVYETCEPGAGGRLHCSGIGLPCADLAHDSPLNCPRGRCTWDNVGLCHDSDKPPSCFAYKRSNCPQDRCFYDPFVDECLDASRCYCSPDGLSGGVQTGIEGCVEGPAGSEFANQFGCYLAGGAAGDCDCATESTAFPGAAWRPCTMQCPAYNVNIPSNALSDQLAGYYVPIPDSWMQLPFGSPRPCLLFPLVKGLSQTGDLPYISGSRYTVESAFSPTGPNSFWFFILQSMRFQLTLFIETDVSIAGSVNLLDKIITFAASDALNPGSIPSSVPWLDYQRGQASALTMDISCVNATCPSVENLTCTTPVSGSAHFSWSNIVPVIYNFGDYTRTLHCAGTYDSVTPNDITPRKPPPINVATVGNTTSTHVAGLQLGVTYSCSITVTAPKCEASTSPSHLTFSTEQAAPSQAPVGVLSVANSPGTLFVRWVAPPLSSRQGLITQYRVRVYPIDQSAPETQVDAVVTSASVMGLEPFTNYTVQVQAVNDKGAGPWSTPILTRTFEGVPVTAPSGMTVARVGQSSARIQWDPLPTEELLGELQNYKVRVSPTNNPTAVTEHLTKDSTVIVSDLSGAGNTYRASVAASTSMGTGPFSSPEIIGTWNGPLQARSGSGMTAGDRAGLFTGIVLLCALAALALLVFQRRRHSRAYIALEEELTPQRNSQLLPDVLADLEIPRNMIKLSKELGEGQFGSVLEGTLATSTGKVHVAAKMLKQTLDASDKSVFIEEACRMRELDHAHVVQILAVVFESEPNMICVELCSQGDLKTYLRERRALPERPALVSRVEQIDMGIQVADGLAYLESMQQVHRDIAARNILINSDGVLKIGDFGMARSVGLSDYYRKTGQAMLPIRWLAPECVMDGVFTSATDMYSFGVLLWEIFSFGQLPWPSLSNDQVIENLSRGNKVMQPPHGCPRGIHNVMVLCWKRDPRARPTAAAAKSLLEKVERLDVYTSYEHDTPAEEKPPARPFLEAAGGLFDRFTSTRNANSRRNSSASVQMKGNQLYAGAGISSYLTTDIDSSYQPPIPSPTPSTTSASVSVAVDEHGVGRFSLRDVGGGMMGLNGTTQAGPSDTLCQFVVLPNGNVEFRFSAPGQVVDYSPAGDGAVRQETKAARPDVVQMQRAAAAANDSNRPLEYDNFFAQAFQ
eukprot:m.331720 g.331720  ORF g.331720 m.331720 type:complete len:1327 (-) comp19773_c0_seq4:213-4193(-)